MSRFHKTPWNPSVLHQLNHTYSQPHQCLQRTPPDLWDCSDSFLVHQIIHECFSFLLPCIYQKTGCYECQSYLSCYFPQAFWKPFKKLASPLAPPSFNATVNMVISYVFSYRCNILWALLELSYLLNHWPSHLWSFWKNLWHASLLFTNHISGSNLFYCIFHVYFARLSPF